jgi:hypothetical protein
VKSKEICLTSCTLFWSTLNSFLTLNSWSGFLSNVARSNLEKKTCCVTKIMCLCAKCLEGKVFQILLYFIPMLLEDERLCRKFKIWHLKISVWWQYLAGTCLQYNGRIAIADPSLIVD